MKIAPGVPRIFVWVLGLAALFILVLAGLEWRAAVSGENLKVATQEAYEYGKHLGVKVEVVVCSSERAYRIPCTVYASESDGSVRKIALECASRYSLASGCRIVR